MSSKEQSYKLTASRSSTIVTSARASQSSDGSWRAPKSARYSAQYLFPASDYSVLDNINAKYRVRQILTQPGTAPGIPRSASTDQLGFRYQGKQPNMTQIQVQAAKNQLDAFRGVQEQAFNQIDALTVRLGRSSALQQASRLVALYGQLRQIRQDIELLRQEIGGPAQLYALREAQEAIYILSRAAVRQAVGLQNRAEEPTTARPRALGLSEKTLQLADAVRGGAQACFLVLESAKSAIFHGRQSMLGLLDHAIEKTSEMLSKRILRDKVSSAASAQQQYIAQLESQLRTLQIAPERPPHGLARGEDGGALSAALQLLFHSAALFGSIKQYKNHLAESLVAVSGESWQASYQQLLQFVSYTAAGKGSNYPICSVQALLKRILDTLSRLASPSSNYSEEIAYDADRKAVFERFRCMCERRQNSLIQSAVSFYAIDELSCYCGAASYSYRRQESITLTTASDLHRALDVHFTPYDAGIACSCGKHFTRKTSLMTAPKQLILFSAPRQASEAPESIDMSRFFYIPTRARYILDAGVRCNASHSSFVRVGSKWWACDGPSVEALAGPESDFCCASFSLDE